MDIKTTQNDQKISAALQTFSPEQTAIIKATVAKNTTDTELAFFLFTCESAGLNPLLKEIWCYKDNRGNLLIFAGRDGFLKKAQSHAKFAGMRSGVIKENDEWDINIPDAKILHKITKADRGAIIGAYAFVFRKEEEPTLTFVEFKSYNKGWSAWKTHPDDMILKVAEIKALKKAFGMSELQSEFDFNVQKNNTVKAIGGSLLPDMTNQK